MLIRLFQQDTTKCMAWRGSVPVVRIPARNSSLPDESFFAIISVTNPWRLFRLCRTGTQQRSTAYGRIRGALIWQKLPLMGKHNLLGFAETTV